MHRVELWSEVATTKRGSVLCCGVSGCGYPLIPQQRLSIVEEVKEIIGGCLP